MAESQSATDSSDHIAPEGMTDQKLVETYADIAESTPGEHTIAEYDAVIQEMAERFEALVLERDSTNQSPETESAQEDGQGE